VLRALVFVSRWCPYCRHFERIVAKLRIKFPEITFELVDIERNPELAKKFEIEMLPTTIILNGDDAIGGIMGFVDERTAEKSLRDQLKNSRK